MSEINNTVSVDPLGKKRDVATMLTVSVRTVDNYISDGCPHYKPSPRAVRFDMAEVKEWFKAKYGQQKRKCLDEESFAE